MEAREQKHILISAVREFEITAHRLLSLLAKTFNLETYRGDSLKSLTSSYNSENEGTLNNEWHYQIEGENCKFKNEKSGQIVDVVLGNEQIQSRTSNFYLYLFIKTTKLLRPIYEVFDTEYKITKVLRDLENEGNLNNFGSLY